MQVDAAHFSLRDRMLMLRGMPAFEPLGEDDLLALAEHASARRYRARDPILVEGEPIANVYVLAEGHVRIERDNQVLADLRERGHIGLISLLAGQASPSAVALSDSLALEVPANVITVTAHERFDIARNSVRLIAAELLSRRNQLPVLPDGVVPDIGVLRPRALTLVERMFRIRQVSPFANANMDAVAELAKHSREVRFEPGTRLWGIGDAAPWALRVDYGLVDCENERGERAVVGAGFTLGALDGVAGARRSYSAVTKTLVVGLELRTAIQLAVLEVHPTLAQELRKTLAMLLVSSGGA